MCANISIHANRVSITPIMVNRRKIVLETVPRVQDCQITQHGWAQQQQIHANGAVTRVSQAIMPNRVLLPRGQIHVSMREHVRKIPLRLR